MKRFAVVLALLTIIAMPAAAQTEEHSQSWLTARLTDISPVTLDSEGKVDYMFTALLVTCDVASVTELIYTRQAMDRKIDGWHFYEVNPLMRFGLQNRPLDMFLKVAGMSVFNYCVKKVYTGDKTGAYVMVGISTAGMLWLTHHNYQLAMKIAF